MSSKVLKKLRVFISVLFLLAFSLSFLDFRRILPEDLINTVTWLQFIPSVLKFINVFTLGAAGFIVVVILTLLFGRVYCSAICPLGIMQDVITWFARKLKTKKQRRYEYSMAWTKLRYGLLIITILFFVFGSIFFINLLDPYSNFGRIFTFFGKPVVI
ncbi:MAG: 4Fe-4S binding protein, partial [Bacteroidota bacterium]|nr:4Fe-4S binding protein [Bacteroidota bacterium]